MLINGMIVEVLATERLTDAAADHIARFLQQRTADQGHCSIAFSGGGTPNPMFDNLAGHPVDWAKVEIFQVDERLVPPGHPDHNFSALDQHLISKISIPPDQVHPMETEASDPKAAALRYGRILLERAPDGLDMVHLGVGSDGHTASWPPDDPVIKEAEPVAVAGPYQGHQRMTITPPVVRGAGSILWLIAGAAKAQALRQLIDSDPQIPAWHARIEGSVILADPAAGRLIQ